MNEQEIIVNLRGYFFMVAELAALCVGWWLKGKFPNSPKFDKAVNLTIALFSIAAVAIILDEVVFKRL